MGLSNRRRKAVIPGLLYLNLSWSQTRGMTKSWTIKVGPWSYNTRQRTSTFKLLGGFKYRHKHGQGAGTPSSRRTGTPARTTDPDLAEARRRVRDLERRAREMGA